MCHIVCVQCMCVRVCVCVMQAQQIFNDFHIESRLGYS